MVQLAILGGLITPRYGGGGGGGDFPVNAVHFDGSNDYLARGGDLTGAANGENILISFWFNMAGGDGVFQSFLRTDTNGARLERNSSDKIVMSLINDAGGSIWKVTSTSSFSTSVNAGWHHLLITAQLDVSPVAHIYLDDASLDVTENTAPLNGDINMTGTDWGVGADPGAGAQKAFADMAEVYFTDEFLDISVESNRRKFIDASGFPVDVGSDGSTPTGTAALIFMQGATVSWHTNDGSGGGFTENGALTDAATNPSD